MECIKIVVSDKLIDKEQANDKKMWFPYQPDLTVESLFEGVIKQGNMEIKEMFSAVLKDWINYLIIVDGKSIRHREGLETKIVNGSDIVIFIQFLAGG